MIVEFKNFYDTTIAEVEYFARGDTEYVTTKVNHCIKRRR